MFPDLQWFNLGLFNFMVAQKPSVETMLGILNVEPVLG